MGEKELCRCSKNEQMHDGGRKEKHVWCAGKRRRNKWLERGSLRRSELL